MINVAVSEMAKEVVLSVFVVLLTCCVDPIPANVECYDVETGAQWTCSYKCCSDRDYCCKDDFAAAYWYAWLLIALLFLFCLCACVSCATYGYRRRYVITHTPAYRTIAPEPTAPINAYRSKPPSYQAIPNSGYQAPPPYNPGPRK